MQSSVLSPALLCWTRPCPWAFWANSGKVPEGFPCKLFYCGEGEWGSFSLKSLQAIFSPVQLSQIQSVPSCLLSGLVLGDQTAFCACGDHRERQVLCWLWDNSSSSTLVPQCCWSWELESGTVWCHRTSSGEGRRCQPPSLPPFSGDLLSDVEDEGAEAQGLVPKAVLRRWC